MQNPEDQGGLTGTRRVARAIIIRTVEARAVAMGAARMLSKDEEDLLRSLQQVAVVRLAAAMELVVGQISRKAVRRMARLVLAEVRTVLRVVLAIRVMGAGNSVCQWHGVVKRPSEFGIFICRIFYIHVLLSGICCTSSSWSILFTTSAVIFL